MDELDENISKPSNEESHEYHITAVNGLYENWFLDYASYVILERAVPSIYDGLKPVQRRILHALNEMDDGRFNKVANVIGQTMQYHPHGDAAIGEALVNIGQKEILFDTQGNWGDIRTGDSAAASRYIEVRLSKFAHEVVFNKQTTQWQNSYDGRKKEPINLPIKFPLLLAQGVEGIAVGLATKILPHNFNELIQASIDYLKNKKFEIFPDFLTCGSIDVSNYNQGMKGGKIRCRARIEEFDKKTLLVKEIPFGTTTTGIIESIIKANDAGKIKIKKVIDNTAADVEIEIQLAPNVSPDITIDALYAFTDCEVSISPNACVIVDEKPEFLSVNEILKRSAEHTKSLLKLELEIRKQELDDDWHASSLEKIFIEKRIYRDIEECETFEDVIDTIWRGMNKYKKLFRRELCEDDILRLTEIKIKRISKYDSFKADEFIKGLEAQLEQVKSDLENLQAYTIKYFENLLKKFGKGRERRTEIKTFDVIEAKNVAIANQKLYVNRNDGFVGTGLKKDEYICDCSDLDEVIVIRKDGKMQVSKVSDKTFMGKDIIHIDVFRRNDERRIYNLIYLDGKSRVSYVKRFPITGITRDKEYDLTQGSAGSRVIYLTVNPSGEAETVSIQLSPLSHARKLQFDFDFAEMAIKNRSVQGNILSKYLVKSVRLKSKGVSTLGGLQIWYDEHIGRLNTDERGRLLGSFHPGDLLLALYRDGSYELNGYELSNHYEKDKLVHLTKFKADRPISALYLDAGSKTHYIKRFLIETQTLNKKFYFIPEDGKSQLIVGTDIKEPVIQVLIGKNKKQAKEQDIALNEFIDVKGWKALGNKLCGNDLLSVGLYEPEIEIEEEPIIEEKPEKNPQMSLLDNEDLIKAEADQIQKLLQDDSEEHSKTKSKKAKNTKGNEQTHLF